MLAEKLDLVTKAPHYTKHRSGIECREITEHLSSNLANAFKYVFRHEYKDAPIRDIQKALTYLQWEIDNLNNDLTRQRILVQPNKLAHLKAKLTRVHDFEGLTFLKDFYKHFYLMVTDKNNVIKHLNFCIELLTRHLECLERNA